MRAFDRFVANNEGDPELKTQLDLERYDDEYDEFMDGEIDDGWEEWWEKVRESDPYLNPNYYD